MVEFLATGQQFIAVGTHPSGVRYEWAAGLPDAFPVLSLEQFEALWSELAATFGIEAASESQASVKARSWPTPRPPTRRPVPAERRAASSAPSATAACTSPAPSRTSTPATRARPAPPTGRRTRAATSTATSAACTPTASTATTRSSWTPSGYVDEDLMSEFSAIGAPAAAPTRRSRSRPTSRSSAQTCGQAAALPGAARRPVRPGQAPVLADQGRAAQGGAGVLFGESTAGKTFAVAGHGGDIALGTAWRGMRTRRPGWSTWWPRARRAFATG
jgi:hypothetical protein